jgi:uncharacterized paraquat-inducible protein A
MADLSVRDTTGARWRDRVAAAHPMLGSSGLAFALVVVALVSVFVPLVGVVAIAAVSGALAHAGVRAARRR